jgi:hypothetical protein
MTMSGMGMMLKSLGIDPDEIRQNVEVFMQQMKAAIEEVKQNQVRLESKQDLILTNQQHFNLLIASLMESGNTTLLHDHEGKSMDIAISDEKFPQVVIDAANVEDKKDV